MSDEEPEKLITEEALNLVAELLAKWQRELLETQDEEKKNPEFDLQTGAS